MTSEEYLLQHPYDAVDAFHRAFGLLRADQPQLPDEAARQLRINLLYEEYCEYLKGETEDDLVQIADALADMIYIACGTAVAYGIPLDKVFAEVHRSNMAKLVDGKVIRREDGKVLKPEGWTPPDVKGVMGL
jgi:predicted HAD superfamily Cof-like phosphohydrolase